MRKIASLILILPFALSLLCSRNEGHKEPAITDTEKFAVLTDSQVADFLSQAKTGAGEGDSGPVKVLTQSEIDAVLDKVANTNVDQVGSREIALLETSMGTIAFAFYSDIAPEHTRNFKRLVTSGFYNGTRFHRIIENFMIQGGDILTRDNNPDNDGTGGPGYNVPAEFNGIPHDFGILSMVRAQDINSAGSQFFICLSREQTSGLDGKYTVFGKAVGGLDVIRAMGDTPLKSNQYGEKSVSVEPVYIKNAYMFIR